jgi:glycosidase
MQMITNHDLNAWEGTEFDRLGNGVKAFAVLTYTLPGIPMMYTGQEVGFDHAFEFFKQDKCSGDHAQATRCVGVSTLYYTFEIKSEDYETDSISDASRSMRHA